MRLTNEQHQIISSILRKYFGDHTLILLFGSRVDDSAKGGDIDLYIEPEITDPDAIVLAKLKAMAEIHLALGDQKIDLVINRRKNDILPIYQVAKKTGIPL